MFQLCDRKDADMRLMNRIGTRYIFTQDYITIEDTRLCSIKYKANYSK